MLKHIVMWRFIDEAEGQSVREHAEWMKSHLEALVGVVPEIKQLEVGVNQAESPAAFDAVLTLLVEDAEALSRYKAHPAHQAISTHCKAVRSDRVVVDYEVE